MLLRMEMGGKHTTVYSLLQMKERLFTEDVLGEIIVGKGGARVALEMPSQSKDDSGSDRSKVGLGRKSRTHMECYQHELLLQ